MIDPTGFVSLSSTGALRFSDSVAVQFPSTHATPWSGLGFVVGMTDTLQNALKGSYRINGAIALPTVDYPSFYGSLGQLQGPIPGMSGALATGPFKGTLAGLASVPRVGVAIESGYLGNRVAIGGDFLAATNPYPSLVHQGSAVAPYPLARNVLSPYLTTARSIFQLESAFANLSAAPAFSIPAGSTFLPATAFPAIREGIAGMAQASLNTWSSLAAQPAALGSTPFLAVQRPAVEIYSAAQTAGVFTLPDHSALSVDEDIEATLEESLNGFEELLLGLGAEFLNMYHGGLKALTDGGPDWQRHAMTSLRELCTHVLHHLSPDAELLPTAQPGDLHNGRPTRKARLNHIFRGIGNGQLASFYEADLKAALELFDLLNDGTHRLGNQATSDQVRYIERRVAGLLTSMIDAGRI
jgi:hypothetical protein